MHKRFEITQDLDGRKVVTTNLISFEESLLGQFDQIRMRGHKLWKPDSTPAEHVRNEWARLQSQERAPTDGPLWRLENAYREDHPDGKSVLWLDGQRTSYRFHCGTNLLTGYRMRAGWRANPLGVDALLRLKDGFVIGRSSMNKHENPGQWATLGANFTPPPKQNVTGGGGRARQRRYDRHPSDTLRRELEEELMITLEPSDQVKCLGIVQSLTTMRPSILYIVYMLDLDYESFLRSMTPSRKYEEHFARKQRELSEAESHGPEFVSGRENFKIVPANGDAILHFVKDFFDRGEPNMIHEVTAGALLAYGKFCGLFKLQNDPSGPEFDY